ncbi:hypothetical protein, partial [Actinocorallia lasiicapitis]
ARLALAGEFYRGVAAGYGRAELGFLRWEISRGVLAARTGSRWWRAVNDRLLCDKAEAALLSGTSGVPSADSVRFWLDFLRTPSRSSWFRAHNASIVGGYLANEALAERELPAERLMINVALLRVLYTHALAARPRLALGALAPFGPRLADPRGRAVGFFLDLRDSFPQGYPLTGLSVADVLRGEGRLPRLLDHGIIVPRLRELYAFAASSLDEPRVERLLRDDDVPCYADPSIDASAWGPTRPWIRLGALVTAPGGRAKR